MTFQLQAYKAMTVPYASANRNFYIQTLDMYITGAVTDTTLDISSDTTGSLGTFWTAVTADATYGTLATNALAATQSIINVAKRLLSVQAESLETRSMLAAGAYQNYLSAASAGGSATEAYTVTGLLSTDTVVSVTPAVASANTLPTILALTSATISTGTSVNATVTGLATTDTILAVTQSTANANGLVPVAFGTVTANTLPLTYEATSGANGKVTVAISRPGAQYVAVVGYNTLVANGLSVQYQGDPGAGAKVDVLVYRGTGTITPGVGQYVQTITGMLPSITFGASNAPATNIMRLTWLLQDGVMGVNQDAGAAF